MRGRATSKGSGLFLSSDTKKAMRWAISVAPQSMESRPIEAMLDRLGEQWDDPEVQIPAAQRTYLKKVILTAVQSKDITSLNEEGIKHYDQFRYFCLQSL